jgi:hypothetical protein
MKTESTHAERVQRWFAAEVRPAPPTDEELMALASGRHDVIDAAAVAEAMALDAGSQRRYEDVQRFLEQRSPRPAPVPQTAAAAAVPKSLVERAAEWLAAKGAVLAAKVHNTGAQLKAAIDAGGSWDEVVQVTAPTLTMRGFAASSAGRDGGAIVQLKDNRGRRVQVTAGPTGYVIEFDLNDERLTAFLNVQRVALYGTEEAPFERRVLLRGGRGTLSGCPSGLIHVEYEGGFEMYLLLEHGTAGAGPGKETMG